MFNWEGCPLGLFDVYMETGDVAVLPAPEETTTCIEIWVGSTFQNHALRAECLPIRRRPVYGILKQILKLSEGKPVCLIFQCDDRQGDITLLWAPVISRLLQVLRQRHPVDSVLFFTGCRAEQVQARVGHNFHREEDRTDYLRLLDTVDILVAGQPNRHAPSQNRTITAQRDTLTDRFYWLLNP